MVQCVLDLKPGKRAVCGRIQSSKLWSDKLCSVLVANGFVMNPYDPCVFNKMSDDGYYQVTICTHVNDSLITSNSARGIKSLVQYLAKVFAGVTFVHGDSHSYLSMSINRVLGN